MCPLVVGIYKIFLLPEAINQLTKQLSGRKIYKMTNFITVSSQGGSSKTVVNVNSLNRVSYHLSKSAREVVECYLNYGVLGLFKGNDFYSVLDVNGSNINTLDSIDEVEDKLNGVVGSGHGMFYIPNAVLKSNEEVLSRPYMLASYMDSFTDFLDTDKVFRGPDKEVSLAWTDEMLSSLISHYRDYAKEIPEDFVYEFACFLECFPTDSVEIIKGKPHMGIPLMLASNLRIGTDFGMSLLYDLDSSDLKYITAERCVSPSRVFDEGKGSVVGISDYNSVLVSLSFPFKVVLTVESLIKYMVAILKKAYGVERAKEFLNGLFSILCNVETEDLFSYLSSKQAAKFTEVKNKSTVSADSYTVKGDYAYVPLKRKFGR